VLPATGAVYALEMIDVWIGTSPEWALNSQPGYFGEIGRSRLRNNSYMRVALCSNLLYLLQSIGCDVPCLTNTDKAKAKANSERQADFPLWGGLSGIFA
jgi:hypothetical protein